MPQKRPTKAGEEQRSAASAPGAKRSQQRKSWSSPQLKRAAKLRSLRLPESTVGVEAVKSAHLNKQVQSRCGGRERWREADNRCSAGEALPLSLHTHSTHTSHALPLLHSCVRLQLPGWIEGLWGIQGDLLPLQTAPCQSCPTLPPTPPPLRGDSSGRTRAPCPLHTHTRTRTHTAGRQEGNKHTLCCHSTFPLVFLLWAAVEAVFFSLQTSGNYDQLTWYIDKIWSLRCLFVCSVVFWLRLYFQYLLVDLLKLSDWFIGSFRLIISHHSWMVSPVLVWDEDPALPFIMTDCGFGIIFTPQTQNRLDRFTWTSSGYVEDNFSSFKLVFCCCVLS